MHGWGRGVSFSQEAPSQVKGLMLDVLRDRVKTFCSRVFLVEAFDGMTFQNKELELFRRRGESS